MFEKTISVFHNYIGNGLVFLVFFICIIFLLCMEKDKLKRIFMIYFPIFIFILFFCPFFSAAVEKFLDEETYYRVLWLLQLL